MSEPSPSIFNTYVIPQSDTIDARVLAIDTAESHTVPSGAAFVVFSATDDFYCKMDDTPVIPAADVTDGSAPELNPIMREVRNVTNIGLIAPRACVVTMSYYF